MKVPIAPHTTRLSAIARQRGVARLDVFGSAADQSFDDARSEIDLIVSFVERPPGGIADAYFGLLGDLKQLFGREVDLIVERSIRNPYFRRNVEASRWPVYVA